MTAHYQPHATPVPDWTPPRLPDAELVMSGTYATLEPLRAEAHAALLYRAYAGHDAVWTYMPVGPFSSSAQYHRWAREAEQNPDIQFYAILNRDSGQYEGVASFLRAKPKDGSIEVGYIAYAPALQRTRAATEAMYLMMAWAFEAGYRRYEWKCNALNQASRVAAQRLGLSYEGIFRQATVVKGLNRDTAWFAAIDSEWPGLKEAFSVWLHPSNFDANGQQIESLADLTRLVRVADDPGQGAG